MSIGVSSGRSTTLPVGRAFPGVGVRVVPPGPREPDSPGRRPFWRVWVAGFATSGRFSRFLGGMRHLATLKKHPPGPIPAGVVLTPAGQGAWTSPFPTFAAGNGRGFAVT